MVTLQFVYDVDIETPSLATSVLEEQMLQVHITFQMVDGVLTPAFVSEPDYEL
jgi:hypothetical protein